MANERRGAREQRQRRRRGDEAGKPADLVSRDGKSTTPSPDAERQALLQAHPDAPADAVLQSEDPEIVRGKQIAFYQTSIEAFLDNRMERDKSLFALSTGGIGVVIALWTTIGVETRWELGLGIAAGVAFIVAILLVLQVFAENANYFMALITKQDFEKPNRRLTLLDRCAGIAFCVGLALAVAGAVLVTHRKYLEQPNPPTKDARMIDTSDSSAAKPAGMTGDTPAPSRPDGMTPTNESANGFHKLQTNFDTGSAKNFHQLAPQAPALPAAPPASPPAVQDTAAPRATSTTNADSTQRP